MAKRPRLYHAAGADLVPMLGAIAAASGAFATCPSRAGGRNTAISPPRRAERSRRCGPTPKPACRDETAGDRRGTIIAKIRQGLGTYIRQGGAGDTSARRLAEPAQPLVPERAKKQADERRVQLRTFLEGQSATFVEVAGAADGARGDRGLPALQNNLPLRVRVGDDPCADGTGKGSLAGLTILRGRAEANDEVGICHAAGRRRGNGHAGHGSGGDNPVTLNFVPETHIVVVEEKTPVAATRELR